MIIQRGQTILFQGDSVTDCGRTRSELYSLGYGYPSLISAFFRSANPDYDVTFINKGISGNRAIDLESRWQEDAIALKPDIVSILIGINDTWRRFDSNDPTTAENFKAHYNNILLRTREALDDVVIVLLEPFVLPVPDDRKGWRIDLDPKIHAVRELAADYCAHYIPLDGLFASQTGYADPSFWAEDGVHPTMEGHALIARSWLSLMA